MPRITIKKRDGRAGKAHKAVQMVALLASVAAIALAGAAAAGAESEPPYQVLDQAAANDPPEQGQSALDPARPSIAELGVPPAHASHKNLPTRKDRKRRTLSGLYGWNVFAGFAECGLWSPRDITIYPAQAGGTNVTSGVLDWQKVYWQPIAYEYNKYGTLTKTAIGPQLHTLWMSDSSSVVSENNWHAADGYETPYYRPRRFTLLPSTTRFQIVNLFTIFDWNSQSMNTDVDISVTRC